MIRKFALFWIVLIICNKNDLLSQNLIAHYPFDNNASDISVNKNDGKIIGGVTRTPDRFGNPCGALKFNGTDGYIEVPNSSSLQSPVQTFSATCWFKIDDVSLLNRDKWLTLICKGDQSFETIDNPQYRVQIFQSAYQSTISINTLFTEFDNNFTQHKFEFGKWSFYALVYDGSFVRTYLNNIKIWEFAYNNPLTPNTEPLHIGKDIPGSLEFFGGSLDDLRIYNAPLSESEISKLYNETSKLSLDDEFTLTCPDNITTKTEKGKCYEIVNYPKPEFKVNCGSASLIQLEGLLSGSPFPVGVSSIVFAAESNSGYKKTCSSKIAVLDKEPPVINCSKDITLSISDIGQNSIKYDYELPPATDNCSAVDIKLINGLSSGSEFPIGTSQLTFKATDKSNNSSVCRFNVIVKNEAAVKARMDALEKARQDSIAKVQADIRAKFVADSIAKVLAEEKIRLAQLEKAKQDSIAKAKAVEIIRMKFIEDSIAKVQADEKIRLAVFEQARKDSVIRAKAEEIAHLKFIADSIAKAQAEEKNRLAVIEKTKQDSIAKVKAKEEEEARRFAREKAQQDSIQKIKAKQEEEARKAAIAKAYEDSVVKAKAKAKEEFELQETRKKQHTQQPSIALPTLDKEYPEGISEDTLKEAKRTIFRTVIKKATNQDVFLKIIYSYATYYFKNEISLSESNYRTDLKVVKARINEK